MCDLEHSGFFSIGLEPAFKFFYLCVHILINRLGVAFNEYGLRESQIFPHALDFQLLQQIHYHGLFLLV